MVPQYTSEGRLLSASRPSDPVCTITEAASRKWEAAQKTVSAVPGETETETVSEADVRAL
jgi:hypothetical protein